MQRALAVAVEERGKARQGKARKGGASQAKEKDGRKCVRGEKSEFWTKNGKSDKSDKKRKAKRKRQKTTKNPKTRQLKLNLYKHKTRKQTL